MVVLLLYSFAIGDLRGFVLVFFVGYLVIALLPELTLRPILMGRRTLVSPVIMFIGFMGGIMLLGVGGFLIGPLVLAVAVTWYRLRKEGRATEPGAPAWDYPSLKDLLKRMVAVSGLRTVLVVAQS
jgi:predicted PurR-regulated permease PerM